MNILTLLAGLLLSFGCLTAQSNSPIHIHLEENGILELTQIESHELSRAQVFATSMEWVRDHLSEMDGKVIYQNAYKGELIVKGKKNIPLGKSGSAFQTRMFFTLRIAIHEDSIRTKIQDIYYQSLPEYGKQGTPAIISYPQDWLQASRLKKKNGKTRWLNQYYKENSIEAGQEILASLQRRF